MSDRSSWHLSAHLPMVGWIVVLAVLVLTHRFITGANGMMLHVTFLGIAANAVLIWTTRFTEALLHLRRVPLCQARSSA